MPDDNEEVLRHEEEMLESEWDPFGNVVIPDKRS